MAQWYSIHYTTVKDVVGVKAEREPHWGISEGGINATTVVLSLYSMKLLLG